MRTFAIFAKYWEIGKVKTRLGSVIGDSRAAEIYLNFLRLTLKKGENLDLRKILAYSPSDRLAEFNQLAPAWSLIPQVESDLGMRMKAFFDQAFELGHSSNVTPARASFETSAPHRVVLIGSDTPFLPSEWIESAFDRLLTCDVVLGPSKDGGYYLIGANEKTPNVFENVDWSTGQVLNQTIANLQQQNDSFELLEEYRDVDELSDLIWLVGQLESHNDLGPDASHLLRLMKLAVESCHRSGDSPREPL